jgi:uncharacterized protein YjiK
MSNRLLFPFLLNRVPVVLLCGASLFLCFECGTHSPLRSPAATRADSLFVLPYDLTNPSLTINLVSDDLKEISDLSPTDQPGIFCTINDEVGEVFFIEGTAGGKIARRVPFHPKGDFEGVEMVKNTLYAVQSDGDIFEVTKWENAAQKPNVIKFETGLEKANDVEGLCYDPQRNALLLACKGDPNMASGTRDVWAFDLKTQKLGAEPVYRLPYNLTDGLVPPDGSDKHPAISPSAIAIHPLSGDVYVLSSALKRLVVLNYQTGALKAAIRLDRTQLPQPEGLAFDAKGNLYICSEGKKGEGLLLVFNFKK